MRTCFNKVSFVYLCNLKKLPFHHHSFSLRIETLKSVKPCRENYKYTPPSCQIYGFSPPFLEITKIPLQYFQGIYIILVNKARSPSTRPPTPIDIPIGYHATCHLLYVY